MMKKSFSLMDAGAERRVTCRADRPIPGRAQPHTTLNIIPHLYLISLANDYLKDPALLGVSFRPIMDRQAAAGRRYWNPFDAAAVLVDQTRRNT
jgi:hypothetical protein